MFYVFLYSKWSHYHFLARPPPPNQNILSAAVKVGLTLAAGLYLGAELSKKMVNFLEENEIFIPEEAEDDWWNDVLFFIENIFYVFLCIEISRASKDWGEH